MASPVKMGIEIEYLVSTNTGKPIDSGYGRRLSGISKATGLRILSKAAKSISSAVKATQDRHGHVRWDFKDGSSLMPDTFALLETVTGPSSNLDQLRDQLWTMKNALIEAAASCGCVVSGAACPVSYKYDDIRSNANVRCNNAGMHIHLNAPDDKIKIKLANTFTQVIPELAALAANSSVYNRRKSQYASKRLSVSPLVGAKAVEVYKYDPDQPLQPDDPNKRYRFVTVFAKKFTTVELRGFDTPMNIDWAMSIAALVQCLAVKATKLFVVESRNTVMSNSKTLRGKNFDCVVRDGFASKLSADRTTHMMVSDKPRKMSFLYHNRSVDSRKSVQAALAVKRLLYYVEQEVYELGLRDYLLPLYEATKDGKNQAQLQYDWFDQKGYGGFFRKLQAESGKKPANRGRVGGTRRNYFTVRQRGKGTRKDRVYLTANGLQRISAREGNTVTISGPLGSVDVEIAWERGSGDTIPLGDEEVRLGRRYRNQLGVSMYDPVIIGDETLKPLVILKAGAKWTFSPEGEFRSPAEFLTVQSGLKKHALSVVLNVRDARSRGIQDGDIVTVVGPGGKNGEFTVVVNDELKRGIIAMMQNARTIVGVDVAGKVSIGVRERVGPAADTRKLTVKQGDKDDIACRPPVIRLHKGVLLAMNLSEGDNTVLEVSGDDGKRSTKVIVKVDRKGYGRNDAGLVKSFRDELGLKAGDTIVLHAKGMADA